MSDRASAGIIERRQGVSTPIEQPDIHIKKYEEYMTKAKARQRAKAKAAEKARKREAGADRPGQKIQPGQFDPGASSIKGPRVNTNIKNFAGAKRGTARSR